jgi:ketosteroid isomerase-like protein
MSAENIEIVRRSWEAWKQGDGGAALSCYDRDIVWEPAEDEPDSHTARGVTEVIELMGRWVGSFEGFTGEPLEFIDAGDDIVVPMVFTGRPHGSEQEVTLQETQVFTLRDGLIVRVREFRTKAEALAALGLDE